MLTNEDSRSSTKACACGETRLVLLASIDRKLCPTCRAYIVWTLDKGQRSLNGPSRAGRGNRGL